MVDPEICGEDDLLRRVHGPPLQRGGPPEGLTRNRGNGPRWTGKLRLVEDAVDEPLRWRRPRLVFVNSMSDLFHEKVPLAFIRRVFTTMETAERHTSQILTKRSDRLLELAPQLRWPSNVWMGVSVENADCVSRIDRLRQVPAKTRFLSLEPLLGPMPGLDLNGIHWVIVGGESGRRARPMRKTWVREIRRQCRAAEVPFFFKQWGGVRKARIRNTGEIIDGSPLIALEHDRAPSAGSSCASWTKRTSTPSASGWRIRRIEFGSWPGIATPRSTRSSGSFRSTA